jgi:hypothetical protein
MQSFQVSGRRSQAPRTGGDSVCDPRVAAPGMRVVRRLAVLVLVVVCVAMSGVSAASSTRAVALTRTPSYIARLCKSVPALAPACPKRIPYINHLAGERAYDLVSLCRRGKPGCAGVEWDDLNIGASGNGDRPPIWTHLTIFAGRLTATSVFPFHYPTGGPVVAIRDGLFAEGRPRAVYFGHVHWGGKTGTLVLAPSFPAGGEQGGHLIFRWRHGSGEYAIGLHGWEPFLQTAATLREIIASTGPG